MKTVIFGKEHWMILTMKSKAQMEIELRRLRSEKQQAMDDIQNGLTADWSLVDFINGKISILEWILGE